MHFSKIRNTLTSILGTSLMSPAVFAAVEPKEHFDVATTIGSLFIVILVIVALMFVLKKMRVPSLLNHKDLAIVRQIPVGQKERLAVVKAGDEHFLVGITQHNINLVSKLETPLSDDVQDDSTFGSQLSKMLNKNSHG
ncbi:flagellar biosynthetic protein FliO [Vibrio astriarenae]|uniref:Flagellar protein n=2 Tax=Vibrio astriarenae TaxID=1481923 RepID=A0A7Z2YDB2_9VIBR|nr:flagellar biosynthetic protein FliO [Vibrio astriarenae]